MVSWWFKSKAYFGFCHQLLMKLSRVRGKRNKQAWFGAWFRDMISGHDFGTVFLFSNFWNLWKFRNRSWYQLKHMYLISYQLLLELRYILVKFWHTIKRIWSMPLKCRYTKGYCLTCAYSCIKFHCSKVRGS